MPSTKESMADSLTPKQKARLHEVADGMLQIYHTLVRMRYLNPAWIQPGPHDVTAQMPLYESLGLDPSIIYLSHILPYIDPAQRRSLDFYDGGYFIDLRDPDHIEQARDPMYDDNPAGRMRPWMTPLSVQGNHTNVILYDAKRHVIGIFHGEGGGSGDRNWYEGVFTRPDEDGTERYFKSRDSVETELSKEEWEVLSRKQQEEWDAAREEEDEEWDEDDEEDDEEEEEEEMDENHWDEMDARPAGKVLRDIVRWYHKLIELPGNGENDSNWSADPVKELYQKHGWPGEDFDGEAFLIDKVRAEAARRINDTLQEPFNRVSATRHNLTYRLEHEASDMAMRQEKLAAAKTLEEEWLARWEIFRASQIIPNLKAHLPRVEEAASRHERPKPEDLPLWELKQIHIDLLYVKRKLEQGGRPTRGATEEELAILEKAYAASLADAERLCPGRAPFPLEGREESDPRLRLRDLEYQMEDNEREVGGLRAWIATLPEGVVTARREAQFKLDRWVEGQERCENELRACREVVERAEKKAEEAGEVKG